MEIVYADAVLSLRQYWKENGIRDDPAKVSGLNKFRRFLEETDQPYSHSTALTWLDEQKDALLSGAGNLALPAFRIGCDGLNLFSFHRRRETERYLSNNFRLF